MCCAELDDFSKHILEYLLGLFKNVSTIRLVFSEILDPTMLLENENAVKFARAQNILDVSFGDWFEFTYLVIVSWLILYVFQVLFLLLCSIRML